MIAVSMATASKRRRMADRFTRTNNLTLAEVSMAETTPDPIPTGYHEAVNLLRRYAGLLRTLLEAAVSLTLWSSRSRQSSVNDKTFSKILKQGR
jgi:hypothetical protein